MLRSLIRNKLYSSLRKIKKTSKTALQKENIKKNDELSSEQKKFNDAKIKIMKKYKQCSVYDLIEEGVDLESFMDMEYKKYPYHIDHWNPESKNYVKSHLEEDRLHKQVNEHNNIIDDFKNSLKIQKQVIEKIKKLDRPYLKSGEKGNTQNIYNPIKNYSQNVGLGNSPSEQMDNTMLQYQNEKMFVNNIPFHAKTGKSENWEELNKYKDEAPVNDHFHPKGYKFDVATPLSERYPHVADRLGHPEIFLTPLESLLRMDRMLTHPNFVDQPFIKTPKAEPDEDVNFTRGEILYENNNSTEWNKFFIYTSNLLFSFFFAYVPFHNYYLNTTVCLDSLAEMGINYFQYEPTSFDTLNLFPVGYGVVFLAGLFINNGLVYKVLKSNVEKIQYNQDKDLVFIRNTGMFGFVQDKVYEMDHLEIKAGYNKSATGFYDFSDKGMINVECLNTSESFRLQNHPRYWNEGLKEDFFKRVTRLWDKNYVEDGIYEKYTGSEST